MALIAVQVMFSTWPIVGKVALKALPSVGLVAFRVAGAALAFILIGALRGRIGSIQKRDWPLLVASSLLGVVLNQWLFVKGLSLTSVINATLLGHVDSGFHLAGQHRLGASIALLFRRIIGICLAAAGVLYLIGPERAEFFLGPPASAIC